MQKTGAGRSASQAPGGRLALRDTYSTAQEIDLAGASATAQAAWL